MERSARALVLAAAALVIAAGCGGDGGEGRYALMKNGVNYRLELWEADDTLYYRRIQVGGFSFGCRHSSCCPDVSVYVARGTLLTTVACGVRLRGFASASALDDWNAGTGFYPPHMRAALRNGVARSRPPWVAKADERIARHVKSQELVRRLFGPGVSGWVDATPRPILWFGPAALGSRASYVSLSRRAYKIEYEGRRRFQIVQWPAGSWLGRYYLRQFGKYPTITSHGVTAYGLRDLVFRTRGSIARVRANPPFSKAERRRLLDALRALSP